MDATYKNDALFPPNAEDGAMVQSGSVAIDPKTGVRHWWAVEEHTFIEALTLQRKQNVHQARP